MTGAILDCIWERPGHVLIIGLKAKEMNLLGVAVPVDVALHPADNGKLAPEDFGIAHFVPDWSLGCYRFDLELVMVGALVGALSGNVRI